MSIPSKIETQAQPVDVIKYSASIIGHSQERLPIREAFCKPCLLSVNDIDDIMDLEKATWIPDLQASRETILNRLSGDHRILALRRNSEYLGMVGWCYSSFSIDSFPLNFPKNFLEFASRSSVPPAAACSAIIYNVGVKPSGRKQGIGSLLLKFVFERIIQEGISQVFLDSRMPSYSGSLLNSNELIIQNLQFKAIVDSYFRSRRMPLKKDLALDPTIRFYLKNGFEPWFFVNDFITDYSSGNNRLICHKAL